MSVHLTEEEQIENLKNWWKENGTQTLLTVVLAVGGYFGFNAWKDHRQNVAEQASDLYMTMQDALAQQVPGNDLTEEQLVMLHRNASTLKADHSGTQYANYAGLILARLAVEEGDLESAATELSAVVSDATDNGIKAIATLRLARVQAALGQTDTALATLDSVEAGQLAAKYSEVRGDIYLGQGVKDKAYEAYQTALEGDNLDGTSRSILELKLSQVKPASDTATDSSAAQG